MYFSYEPLDVSLVVLAAFAAWVIYFRLFRAVDTNLPLILYGVAVAFQQWFDVPLREPNEHYALYAGVLSALVLRFEFLSRWAVWPFRLLDVAVEAYFLWRCIAEAFNIR
jgi:hypothetical protein